jgi:large subunit ribosomal protein L27
MAHKKAGGSTQLGRDSHSKRLGVKIYSGQPARAGEIIIRQRGTRYRPGTGVKIAGDDTLYAAQDGTVQFTRRMRHSFTNGRNTRTIVSVK